jgi:hypothetical protein
MKEHGLSVVCKGGFDAFDELVAKNATFSKITTIFKVNHRDAGVFVGFNGELINLDNGIMAFAEIIVGD